MPRVFVVQENVGHDISHAAEYGDIITLLPPGPVSFSTTHTLDRLEEGLADFQAEDYLLLTGDTVAIAQAAVVANMLVSNRRPGSALRLLKWNRQRRQYTPIMMPTV